MFEKIRLWHWKRKYQTGETIIYLKIIIIILISCLGLAFSQSLNLTDTTTSCNKISVKFKKDSSTNEIHEIIIENIDDTNSYKSLVLSIKKTNDNLFEIFIISYPNIIGYLDSPTPVYPIPLVEETIIQKTSIFPNLSKESFYKLLTFINSDSAVSIEAIEKKIFKYFGESSRQIIIDSIENKMLDFKQGKKRYYRLKVFINTLDKIEYYNNTGAFVNLFDKYIAYINSTDKDLAELIVLLKKLSRPKKSGGKKVKLKEKLKKPK